MMRAATWVGMTAMALGLAGCATIQELAALRLVDFSFDRVSDVKLAGIRLGDRTSFSQLGASEAAVIGLAVTAQDVPLDLVVHVRALNPADNKVSARLTQLDWTFFVEESRIADGKLASTYLLPPGEPVDVPLAVRIGLLDHFQGGARELFELALAIAGTGAVTKEIRIEAKPTVQTSMGPLQYPGVITIRREVGSR